MTQSTDSKPDSKYSPTADQQDGVQVPVGIAQPDGKAQSSEGNQQVKEALEHLHPKDLARNLDPSQPDQAPTDDQNTAPFASYDSGKVPDTAQTDGAASDASLPKVSK